MAIKPGEYHFEQIFSTAQVIAGLIAMHVLDLCLSRTFRLKEEWKQIALMRIAITQHGVGADPCHRYNRPPVITEVTPFGRNANVAGTKECRVMAFWLPGHPRESFLVIADAPRG